MRVARSRLRQLIRGAMAAVLPRRLFLVRGPRRSTAVCLTFDDGPDPNCTPALLDILKKARVPATFFVIGQRAEQHPDIVRRIVAEGHTLGNHSFTHSDPAQTSARDLLEEVRRTRTFLSAVTGHAPTLFRPPHGKLTTRKLLGLWREGQTIVLWNVDPKDFACRSDDELRATLRTGSLQGGDVVLLHDVKPTVAVLPELIDAARRSGLTFSTPFLWLRQPVGVGEGLSS